MIDEIFSSNYTDEELDSLLDQGIVPEIDSFSLKGSVSINDLFGIGLLKQISDVEITTYTNNDFLVYNNSSSKWVNKTPTDALAALGITAISSELNYNDIATLGVAESSKVLTFDSNGISKLPDSLKLQFGTSSDMQLYHDGTNSFLTNAVGTLKIATETSGIPVQIGHSTSEVTIGQNLTVTGNLTVNGTTTTVNSTVTKLDDPIITLGGDTAPGSDDNKDRGVEFRWHNGSAAKLGFFGYDDSASKFTFIPDATNASETFNGAAGDVSFGGGEFSGDLVVDTSTLKVDATSNRVGIGTASPLKTLHVVDTASDVEIARFQGADGNVAIEGGAKITFSRNAINYLSCTHPSGSIRLETGGAGNSRLTIDSTGNSTFTGDVILDNAKSIRLSELDTNGTNHISIKAPNSVTTDVTLVLPDGAGTNGQALTTDGSGNLSWAAVSGFKTWSSKTSTFTAAVNNHYSIDTTNTAINVNLPQLSTTISGESIVIKFRNGTNFLTLVPHAGNTIEGLNNLILTDSAPPGQSVTLVSNGGAAWEII